ncbi:MAG: hypothetical protein ACF8MF_10285 [Phycisphaerales bacterium JB052]
MNGHYPTRPTHWRGTAQSTPGMVPVVESKNLSSVPQGRSRLTRRRAQIGARAHAIGQAEPTAGALS